MSITRNLYDSQSDKIFDIILDGTTVTTQSGKKEKPRITQKDFPDEAAAIKHFTKKEWERLKKGYVLRNENPAVGQPKLHYFINGGHTGALSFQDTPEGTFVYKNGHWYYSGASLFFS